MANENHLPQGVPSTDNFLLDTPRLWIKRRGDLFRVTNGRGELVLSIATHGNHKQGNLGLEVFPGDTDSPLLIVQQIETEKRTSQFRVKAGDRDLAFIRTERRMLSSRAKLIVRRLDVSNRNATEETGIFRKVAGAGCGIISTILLLILVPTVGLAVIAIAASLIHALLVVGLVLVPVLIPILIALIMTGRIGVPYIIFFETTLDGIFVRVGDYVHCGLRLERRALEGDLTLPVIITVLRKLGAIANTKSDSKNKGLAKYGWDVASHLLLTPLDLPSHPVKPTLAASLRAGMGPYANVAAVKGKRGEKMMVASLVIGLLAVEFVGGAWFFGLFDEEQRNARLAWVFGEEKTVTTSQVAGDTPEINNSAEVGEGKVNRENGSSHQDRNEASDEFDGTTSIPHSDESSPRSTPAEKLREWTDDTGRSKIQATLLRVHDGQVRLLRQDGKEISLPLERLSANDRQYVKSRSRTSENDVAPPVSVDQLSHASMKANGDNTEMPREWTDTTGQSRVTATLIRIANGSVRLLRQDGKEILVPLDRLSDADRQYIRSSKLNVDMTNRSE